MGRDSHHRNSNKNNRNRKGNFNKSNSDKSWQTESRLLETEVGIDKYISENDEGFQALIKSRFSDFHVNEITLNGDLAILTDFSLPKNTTIEATTDDSTSSKLKDFIDDEKIKEIENLIESDDFHKSVLIEVTDYEKDRRGELHEILRNKYGGKLTNNTITRGTDRKFIQMKKFSRGDKIDKRGWQWPNEFVHFILFKENVRNNNSNEAKILRVLAANEDKKFNYLQALQALPRNMLMLYTHAYQSLIFNQVASKRRKLGMTVIEGDLVFKENNANMEILIEEKIESEENEIEEIESKYKDMVKALTKEDVESGKYSIFDIVLVLPGHDITYPKGVIGDYYVELMGKDDLSSDKLKNKHKVFSLGGAYRKVFVKPDDFSYKFLKYNNHNDDLILSDYSKMRNDPKIESKPDGKLKALILDFKLPGSTYATMLLRELLKTDTSIQTQIKLHNELTKNDNSLKRKLNDEDEKCEKTLKLE